MAFEQDTLFKQKPQTTERALFDGMLDWIRKTLEFGETNKFEFVELILESPITDNANNLSETRDLIESFKIPVNFHAPFINNNIIDFSWPLRDGSIREYETVLDFACTLKKSPSSITVHPGHVQSFLMQIYGGVRGIYFEQALKRLALKSWPQQTSICFESLPMSSNFFNKIDEIVGFTNQEYYKKFNLTLDTSHLWICEDMAGFDTYFKRLGHLVKNMHLVDNKTKDNDPHVPVGKGVIDFKEIARCIKKYKYDGDLVIEHGGPSAVLRTREYLNSLLK
nr:sugar phosphate isomerase/epimerase family protein [Candidatus Sigynarchaeota archaeon]